MSGCGCDSVKGHLTPVDEAMDKLLSAARSISETEAVPITDALGRVLAEAQTSQIDVPPADNSAMDGYAIASADAGADGEVSLRVAQRICAGEVGEPLQAGTAARIFTGAPIPPGADAIVMQEHTRCEGDNVIFSGPVKAGQHARKAGEDIASGAEILAAGRRLRPQELGLLASVGIGTVPVFRRLKVGIFFTGDELVEPGQPLGPGKIYDSNRYTLLGLLQTLGCHVIDLGVVVDTLEDTKAALKVAAGQADLIITSGGVSVGEEDHVRVALEELGQLDMWRIAVKPGKPLAFGSVDNTPFVGLPGNPVSAFVTFCLFVSPFIKTMQGMADVRSLPLPVRAAFEWPKPGKRQEYLRIRLVTDTEGRTVAESYHHQGSGVLTSTSWGDGLAMIPVDTTVTAGDMVEYYPFTSLVG